MSPLLLPSFTFKAGSGNIILLIASVKLIEDTKFLLSVGGAMIYVTLNAPEPHQMAQRMGLGFKGWGQGVG